MTNFSPVAQAVRNAYHEICEDYIETWLNFNHNRGLAAVLRAAADQVVPQRRKPMYADSWEESAWTAEQDTRADLLAIAAELEGAQ